MAFPTDIAVQQNSALVDRTFTTVAPPKGGGTRRVRADLAYPLVQSLDFKQSEAASSVGPVSRRLASLNWTEINAAGKPVTQTCNLTLIVPRDPIFSLADTQDMVYYVKNFFTLANIEKFLRGEM